MVPISLRQIKNRIPLDLARLQCAGTHRRTDCAARPARPFRVQPFEVAKQQQPEVAARRQTRPANPVGEERRALRFDEPIEAGLVEHTIQACIERA